MLRKGLPAFLWLAAAGGTAWAQDDEGIDLSKLPPPAARPVDFSKDVRPILEARCWKCHGPDKQKGGLALHDKAKALAGGDQGPPLVAKKSQESLLIHYVAEVEPGVRMPPEGAGDLLSAEEVGILRAWIDQGADWPESANPAPAAASAPKHWSFIPPNRPELPEVKDPSWARNPIDRFILARLEKEGLRPAPEADKAALLRRLSLDLIGLPPTLEEADAFLKDSSPDAYEKQVERLLASPHYGERWARQWLDRARYSDTNGYEKDRDRSIWPWRDWVIRAYNEDMPFDRFTIEQIAGDLLPNATPSQRIATGFHRNTMINEEGGIDVAEYRFISVVDRVATTGSVWLGLTVGCAQCHTHKYDPITQREYYQFFAFLDNADEPEIDVPDPAIEAKRQAILGEIAVREAKLAGSFPPEPPSPDNGGLGEGERRRRNLQLKQAEWERAVAAKCVPWTMLAPKAVASQKNATMTVNEDLSVLASGDKPNNDVYEVDLVLDEPATAIRLEALPDPSLPDGGPGRAPLFSVGDFILTDFRAKAGEKEVRIARATEDYSQKDRPAALAIDDKPDTGWTVQGGIGAPHAAVFEFAEEVPAGPLHLTIRMEGIHQMTLGRFRVSATKVPKPVSASGLPAEIERIVLRCEDERTPEEAKALTAYYLSVAPETKEAREAIAKLRTTLPRHPTTMVMRERDREHARVTQIHHRGEFLSPRDPVEPGVLAVLPPLPPGAPKNRLGLALWLVSPENPLTRRVLVNQLWQSYFGRGLVSTSDDFGTRGSPPSHPELLDWLASEVLERGWSLKAMHRLIATSATYRQDSAVSPEALARDPRNELLTRGPRLRVEAETIRDIALTASGLLNRSVGGPSVHPPQPAGVTEVAYGQSRWETSTGPNRYRRGLYTFIKRTAPYAAFATFDMPTPEACAVRRERSNTPLQALTTLNDPVFLECAQALGRRVMAEIPAEDDSARIAHAFRLVLTRTPSPQEASALAAYLAKQRRSYEAQGDAAKALAGEVPPGASAAEAASWTALARVLLNLDEAVTKE